MSQIKTYPEMNETIKDLLHRSEEPMHLYILARIEELEKQVSDLTPPPNDPLTMEQLREMQGEPVWVEVFVGGIKSHWGIVNGNYISDGKLPHEKGKCLLLIGDNCGYDLAWRAYRRKPEKGITSHET